MAAVWQQALALDAKFNAYRTPNNPQFSMNLLLELHHANNHILVPDLNFQSRKFHRIDHVAYKHLSHRILLLSSPDAKHGVSFSHHFMCCRRRL
jgi:hypothetical protein